MNSSEIETIIEKLRNQQPCIYKNSKKAHSNIVPYATYSPWLQDLEFRVIFEKINPNSLVDVYRCWELWNLAKQSLEVEGNILEVGVWRGGTGALIADAIKSDLSKKVYLADTFSGVVKSGENDPYYDDGEHSDTTIDFVKNLLNSASLSNFELLQGVFPEDTGNLVQGKISLLHCDVDVYQSTKDVVEWCLPKFTIGSIIVFDDYGFYPCEGVTIFCEEFKSNKDFIFLHNLNGHAIFIKIK